MKVHKRKARLLARQAAYDALRSEGSGHRKGSKIIRTGHGDTVMVHRPGSNKK